MFNLKRLAVSSILILSCIPGAGARAIADDSQSGHLPIVDGTPKETALEKLDRAAREGRERMLRDREGPPSQGVSANLGASGGHNFDLAEPASHTVERMGKSPRRIAEPLVCDTPGSRGFEELETLSSHSSAVTDRLQQGLKWRRLNENENRIADADSMRKLKPLVGEHNAILPGVDTVVAQKLEATRWRDSNDNHNRIEDLNRLRQLKDFVGESNAVTMGTGRDYRPLGVSAGTRSFTLGFEHSFSADN